MLITDRYANAPFVARRFVVGADRIRGPSCQPGSLLVVIVLSAFISPLGGCSGGGSGGAGSVDISHAKEAAKTNPEIAKAAAARGGGGLKAAQKGGNQKNPRK